MSYLSGLYNSESNLNLIKDIIKSKSEDKSSYRLILLIFFLCLIIVFTILYFSYNKIPYKAVDSNYLLNPVYKLQTVNPNQKVTNENK